VRRRGPKVFTANVFSRTEREVDWRESWSLGNMMPAMFRRRSRGWEPNAEVKAWMLGGEVTSRVCLCGVSRVLILLSTKMSQA